MGKQKEIRVYVVNWDLTDSLVFSNEEFMDEAERQGTVFSLKGFESAFNADSDKVNSDICSIRFL